MTAAPVIKAASGGLTRRLVQTLVIIIVLAAATASATLGLSLLTNANEAFANGFAAHHGADISVVLDTSHITSGQLAATRHVAGVTQVAGPYPELTVTYRQNGTRGESQITLLGRSSAGGRLDELAVNQGHWPTGPGQLVMAVYLGAVTVGSKFTVIGAPGKPTLTIVGVGGSVARLGDEDGWVTPGEIAALTPPRHPSHGADALHLYQRQHHSADRR